MIFGKVLFRFVMFINNLNMQGYYIAQNAIVFRDMYLQCPARNNNG